jgi:hypothetical protein
MLPRTKLPFSQPMNCSDLRKSVNNDIHKFAGCNNGNLRKQKFAGVGNSQVQKSIGATYLQSLQDKINRRIGVFRDTKKVVELCERFGISISCAYRHIKRGTTPAAERHTGRDGKTYPASIPRARPPKSQVMRELDLSRQALSRASRKACEQGVYKTDLAALRAIILLAQSIAASWQEVLP